MLENKESHYKLEKLFRNRFSQLLVLLVSLGLAEGCASWRRDCGLYLHDFPSLVDIQDGKADLPQGLELAENVKQLDIQVTTNGDKIVLEGPRSLELKLGQGLKINLIGEVLQKFYGNDLSLIEFSIVNDEKKNRKALCAFSEGDYLAPSTIEIKWESIASLGESHGPILPNEEIELHIGITQQGRKSELVIPVIINSPDLIR